MGIAAIICFIIAAIAIESGEPMMICIFGGLGLLFAYLWATKDERAKKAAQESAKQNAEKERRIEEQKRQESKPRFQNSAFAQQVINDFRRRSWSDLDFKQDGCQVRKDKIVTPNQTYVYINYGLANLDAKGCELLAIYIGQAYGRAYKKEQITHCVGGYSNSYSGYVDSSGGVSISRDSYFSESVEGYKIYSQATMPPPPPKGRDW